MIITKETLKSFSYRGKTIDVSGIIGHLNRGDIHSARKYLETKKVDAKTAEVLIEETKQYLAESSEEFSNKQKMLEEQEEKAKAVASKLGATLYEYKVLSFIDASTGITDTADIEGQLNRLALEGWRVKCLCSNELGKNALAVLGVGVNGTVDQTVIVLERDRRFAEQ